MCTCGGKCGNNCKCKNKKKTLYPITFIAEDSEVVLVEMTDEEARIVDRILKDATNSLNSNLCGYASIDIEGKVETNVI